ncbi:EF-hand calcium-binding domain-containing protein 13 [Mustela nigripes]|uniref:EF-hand calcium-binding domain-containing protein 13 n=1 Tax=Mustela nigripes TaxID=77151 RepID=UPI0028152E34|nr:EF-hand calcium-binding domain-containing protein 13 [Mustela nigripes]
METKVPLFCQAEENISLSDHGCNSFVTNLSSRRTDNKKDVKFSKATQKRISHEIRDLRLEHKKMNATSVFLCGEEKFSDFSGEENVKREKTLQGQLHTKRTEIASSSVKLSKEKMTRKENSLFKLPNQYSVQKILPPLCTSSSIIRKREMISSLYKTLYNEVPQRNLYSQELSGNHRVDIRDIIFTLDELQHQYEGFSIMEWSALDESTSNRKLSNISECYLQYRKKSALSSRLFEPSLFPKLNGKNLQYHKIMEDNDYLEYKRSKNPLQIKKFPSGIDSSNIGFQELYSKDGINFKKHSEKIEIHDSKSIPHNLKRITSLKKSLDKSDIFRIPRLQKPDVRRHSSPLKQVSSKEKTAMNALENICEAIHKLQENYIAAEELQSILPSLGITLSDKELKKIVTDTTQNESGMVNLDDFMNALSMEQSPPEYDELTNVIKAIDKIKDENMDLEDLNTCLQDFGVYLSKPEFEKITELTEANETKKANFKEFVDTMLTNTERFSEKLLLPDTLENLQNLSKEKMNVSHLWNTLSGMNSNLKIKEFQSALKLATVDGGDEVQIEEFGKVVKDMRDASRLKELQNIVLALDALEGDMIPGKNLESFLGNIGIKSPEEEVEKILKSDFVSDENMVNVKDCMKALKDNQKFSNFIDFKKEALSSNLRLPKADEIEEAIHILSSVDNGKIDIPSLEHALESLNVSLTEEDISEALQRCDINDNNEVNLKDFFERIKESPSFKESTATQLLLATTQILQNDLIDASDLEEFLINNDFHVANVLLNEVLRHEPEHG